MPIYSYSCSRCKTDFELFAYIKDYVEQPKCPACSSKQTLRLTASDVRTQGCSVKKADSELKTLGDLALRNRDRMSDDEKVHLHNKHNEYKDEAFKKPLPAGMSRVKKQPKTIWPGTTGKKKRRLDNGNK
jgi:putative FmdB family regulatory protein